MRIDFTKACESFSENEMQALSERCINGPMVLADLDREVPRVWDAGWDINQGRKLLIVVGGAGPCGYGSVEVRVPLANDLSYYIECDEREGETEWVAAMFANKRYRVRRAEEICRSCQQPYEQRGGHFANHMCRLCAGSGQHRQSA